MKTSWIELNLGRLKENIRLVRAALGGKADLIFVVKSNAYGHGLKPVAESAAAAGVKWFAVVGMEEALDLREILPSANILLMGVADHSEVAEALRARIIITLVTEEQARTVGAEARARLATLACHVNFDTGMGRLGLAWDSAADTLERVMPRGGWSIAGCYSHFASAGSAEGSFAEQQFERFSSAVRMCQARGLGLPFRHMSNSAGFSRGPTWDLDAVRLGILMYGYGPRGTERAAARPFLQWKARVVQVKAVPEGFPVSYDSTYLTPAPTRLVTLGVGYADGYPRLLSNRGRVIIKGKSLPVVGRVTMNFIVVDLGADSDVREGDEAILIGEEGGQAVWADELAEICGTIPYEILTGIKSPLRAGWDTERNMVSP